MDPKISAAGHVLTRTFWESPEGIRKRTEARMRKIAEMVRAFPLSADDAEAIRRLLPPPADSR